MLKTRHKAPSTDEHFGKRKRNYDLLVNRDLWKLACFRLFRFLGRDLQNVRKQDMS